MSDGLERQVRGTHSGPGGHMEQRGRDEVTEGCSSRGRGGCDPIQGLLSALWGPVRDGLEKVVGHQWWGLSPEQNLTHQEIVHWGHALLGLPDKPPTWDPARASTGILAMQSGESNQEGPDSSHHPERAAAG